MYINEMDTKLNPNKICWTKSQLKVHLLYTYSSELSVTRVFIVELCGFFIDCGHEMWFKYLKKEWISIFKSLILCPLDV